MLLLKVCGGTWESASRDIRELSVAKELGYEIEVVAKGDCTGSHDIVAGYKVNRVSTRPLGVNFPNGLNRVTALFTWAKFVKKFNADVITGHDILGLTIAYMSNFGNKKKAKLVYDSHEFEIGRASERSKIKTFLIAFWEKFLMSKCIFSIMVNDSIADEVQRLYRQKRRPIVARNTPVYWKIDENEIIKVKNNILKELSMPQQTFMVMYHGALFKERGIENLLQAISQLPDVCCIILGNGEEVYKKELIQKCISLKIEQRVYFHEAVSHAELYKYVGAADVGIITIPGLYRSYYYMLPNKFFENIQSQTPVIVSDFPEIGELTTKYGIAIKKMQKDKDFYRNCKENIKLAKEELCWENEKKELEDAYRKLLS